MKLTTLVDSGLGQLKGNDVTFENVSTDTRSLKKGDLFVALRGGNFNAHHMLDDALEKGACGIVVEELDETSALQKNASALFVKDTTRALGSIASLVRKSFPGKVLSLTGSCGKTTVKGMLQSVCDLAGSCIATEKNFNNHIGVPFTLLRLKASADYAIVEAGTSGEGEIAYLANLIQPEIALITNVKASHLEGLGSEAAIAVEKSAIYAESSVGTAIVNLDDKYLSVMLERITAPRIIGFSTKSESENSQWLDKGFELVTLNDYVLGENSLGESTSDTNTKACFTAQWNGQTSEISMHVLGKHNIENALAAIACAEALGISADMIKTGLAEFRATPGRMESVAGIHGANIVNDCYNANPGSMRAAIDYLALCEYAILVCGDMGELGSQAEELHREMGAYAKTKGLDNVFAVGALTPNVVAAFGEGAKHFASQDDLIEHIKPLLNEKLTVLIKGSRSTKMENVVKALSLGEVTK